MSNHIQIWRRDWYNKHLDDPGSAIANLSPTATEFIDDGYSYSSLYSNWMVEYDVRLRYRVNNTYSAVNWMGQQYAYVEAKAVKDQTDVVQSAAPERFSISTYPNPFNPSTTISYTLEQSSYVEMNVFDLTGRVVGKLGYETQPAGTHEVRWEAKDLSGKTLSSGIYILRFSSYTIEGGKPTSFPYKLLFLK